MPTTCVAYRCPSRAGPGSMERFFRFPSVKRDRQRREAWIRAVGRQCENGRPWQPSTASRLCGKHFVSGAPSNSPRHPDFVPSLFTCPDDFKKREGHSKKKVQASPQGVSCRRATKDVIDPARCDASSTFVLGVPDAECILGLSMEASDDDAGETIFPSNDRLNPTTAPSEPHQSTKDWEASELLKTQKEILGAITRLAKAQETLVQLKAWKYGIKLADIGVCGVHPSAT